MAVSQFTASAGVLIDGVNLLNGTVDLNGNIDALILDADGDTTISSPTDDQIDIEISGADDFTFTSNAFNVLTGSSIAGPSSTSAVFVPLAVQQALTDGAGVNITTAYSAWTTTTASESGLTDGVVKGHYKKIQLIVDGGNAVLTPPNLTGGTNITFLDVGDFAVLIWDGTSWVPVELGNAVDGATAPVLA